jgi:transcriptional regulator with XRE-family HTH domain
MAEERREGLVRLGAWLRSLRAAAGLSGAELAERANVTQPTVSKVETGRMLPSPEVADRIAGALDLDAATRAELHERLAEAQSEATHSRSGRGDPEDAPLRRANVVRCFAPAMMPPLLRTAEYARQVFAMPRYAVPADDVAPAVAALVDRQGLLYEEQRRFSFVVTEAALRTWPGELELMLQQFDRLAVVSSLSNVRVGVVPWDVRVPDFPLHGFTGYDDQLVTVETFAGLSSITEPASIAAYLEIFAAFEAAALVGDHARDVLSRLADSYRTWSKRGTR